LPGTSVGSQWDSNTPPRHPAPSSIQKYAVEPPPQLSNGRPIVFRKVPEQSSAAACSSSAQPENMSRNPPVHPSVAAPSLASPGSVASGSGPAEGSVGEGAASAFAGSVTTSSSVARATWVAKAPATLATAEAPVPAASLPATAGVPG
jgi:hypothetical protein